MTIPEYDVFMKGLSKKGLFFGFLLLVSGFFALEGQEILTAGRYLEQVSEYYSSMRDYAAQISIQNGTTRMNGTLYHRSPYFLRIDFAGGQIILYNGEALLVYLPGDGAILSQSAKDQETASLATSRGLTLLIRNYIPAYAVGPNPVPLEEGSGERVIKLKLARRSPSEGFSEIILDIIPDSKLIRRITGRTNTGATVRFDFTGIRLNQGIPEQRFIFDAPAATTMYENFLFKDSTN
jgi:outer membrane lipoprotein-sorting protein